MTEDFLSGLDDQRPHNWIDAFPWLKGVVDAGALPIWADAIEGKSMAVRIQRLGQLSELAMERLSQWTIGQIFPGLTPELNLLEIRLPARAANALERHGCNTAAVLIPVRLEEMMKWRNVGVGTIDSILQALADASTSMATPAVTSDLPSFEQPQLEIPPTLLVTQPKVLPT
ncbi:DNA-directed RNA polymerase subunit alpha C-terminal domain-containing protein [Arthrobacter sp. Bi26]|uniref:DNA-directed RNA polymerase subunit alpha C-terminal domain-containing protein n=1 Tax=Arthrobacter sp. Bi26 TaxID=2822350 RepID=UPI001E28461A|nr:DNA-directed RNA polymerase subunit alpha C-terminal domain-containing protein [Arthrobacter sp. Bi26]